MFSITYEP